MQIDNDVANELLLAAKKGQRTQEFFDAVSGIKKYNPHDQDRQGCIRSIFARELISEQFLLKFDEIISIFWKGVFEKLDSAKLFGDLVEIKVSGKKIKTRPTKNNPIHFLRYHGRMAVRNHITSLYRKNLEQGCSVCGYRISVRSIKDCPKCGSPMSTVYKFINVEDCELSYSSPYDRLEDAETQYTISNLLNEFAECVLGDGTKAFQILKILVDPESSRAMCAACKLCGSETFDMNSCTNYNANIGKYLGVNKTMIANKMTSIRRRLPKWLKNKGTDEALYILSIIPEEFQI